MGTEHPVGPEQFRAHASYLDTLRARLGQVRIASQQIGQDQAAFGAQCGWILTGLGDRYVRQDELMAFVEENLLLFVEGLRRVADGKGELAELIGMPDDDTVTIDDSAALDDGSRSASEVMDSVLSAVRNREWVEPLLADAAPVVEFATPLTEGFTALRARGLDWAMADIEPLRRMLDDLTGMPDLVATQATLWSTMATDLRFICADLRLHLNRDYSGRVRPDVRAYLVMMSHNVEALSGLAATAAAMALITRVAGDLILLTRDIVRGLVADLVARVIVWVTETTVVVPLPVTAVRLATVVFTSWRIHAYTTALVTSIANLSRCVDG